MAEQLDLIRAEIASIDLPEEEAAPATIAEALPALPDYKPDLPQVITVGSQIAEFSAAVPVDLRSTIVNCILLAQLAADRWVETHPGTDELIWYNCYISVMKKCGWLVERDESSLKSIDGNGAQVHSEIVQVLTASLGPAATAASIVMSVINGVRNMEKDQPFFTIFDRASQRAEAQLFQISYIAAEAGKAARLNFAAYRVEASASATQILFFKFAGSNARLRTSSADLSINDEILRAVRDLINAKVGGRIAGSVAEIEI